MDINKAKDYFHLGILKGATVFGHSLLYSDGWTIEFKGKIGEAGALLETVRGEVRQFKSLDAAANAVWDIGFKSFEVVK